MVPLMVSTSPNPSSYARPAPRSTLMPFCATPVVDADEPCTSRFDIGLDVERVVAGSAPELHPLLAAAHD